MQIKNSSLYNRFFKVVYTCIFCLTMLFSVFLFSLNASAADNPPLILKQQLLLVLKAMILLSQEIFIIQIQRPDMLYVLKMMPHC